MEQLEQGAGSAAPVVFGAGLVGLGAAAVVIPLLAAPAGGALAAGGVVGGSVLAVGAFLEALQQLQRWGLVNFRNVPGPGSEPAAGSVLTVSTGADVSIFVEADLRQDGSAAFFCDGSFAGPPNSNTSPGNQSASYMGVGVEMGKRSRTNTVLCGTGTFPAQPSEPMFWIRKANGTREVGRTITGNGGSYSTSFRFTETQSWINWRVTAAGSTRQWKDTPPAAEIPEVVRPQLFPPTLPDAPVLPAPAQPLETPTLPPPPDRRPLAPPVVIPRPGQQPARVPVRPGPSGQPVPGGVVRVQPTTGGQSVPAVGPITTPSTGTITQTPPEVVVVDGQIIGSPAQAPAPNLVAIAQELGRLERKNEILLRRPENGGLGEAAENGLIAGLRSLLERLIEELLNNQPADSYLLFPSCPPASGEEAPPPVEVLIPAASNPIAGVARRVDALAELIQAHKDMGQPSCRTAISGRPVTVNFISDP